jgi:HEAT repeats
MKKLIFAILFVIAVSHAQEVISYSGNEKTLKARWNWAIEKAKQSEIENYWIVYTFQRLMPQNSTIGNYYSGADDGKKLLQILYPDRPFDYIESLKGASDNRSSKEVNKEVALLFEMENDQVSNTDMSTIDIHFKLKGKPIIWLGLTAENESMTHLSGIYNLVKFNDSKETIIAAAGMHNMVSESFNFLKKVIETEKSADLREEAVFWIGHTENKLVVPFLKETAMSDSNEDVAEKAVFSLHNINNDESVDAVIFLAKEARDEVRKKAIFWLGQLAGKKAIESLGDIVFSDEETDIQKQAVFALSQLDEGQGISKLIKIANTHPNPKIRKNAIFWLGESDDERALDALIDMAKK